MHNGLESSNEGREDESQEEVSVFWFSKIVKIFDWSFMVLLKPL